MNREQKLTKEIQAEAKDLCAKILKAMGPQKQVVAMNALFLAMQVVDSMSVRDTTPSNAKVSGAGVVAQQWAEAIEGEDDRV
jgi:hypothetical protein